MGFKFRQQIGPKGFKINIGKRGISSASVKIAPGITHNSKRGTTVGVPGTGLSYTFGKNKARSTETSQGTQSVLSKEYSKGWREFTGGYNKKAMGAAIICLLACVTPLWPLGLILSIPSLIWLLIDTSVKVFRYQKHLKTSRDSNGVKV